MGAGVRVVRLEGDRMESMELGRVELTGLRLVRRDGGERRWRCNRKPTDIEGESLTCVRL